MGIFINRDVLRPAFIPEHIIMRKKEVDQLWQQLSYLLAPTPSTPYHTHVFGPRGTGKTVIIKYLMKKLRSEIDTSKATLLYTVCLSTSFSTLTSLLSHASQRPRGVSRSWVDFWSVFSETFKEKVVVVVLDDIDKLMENKRDYLDLLYDLSRRDKTAIISLTNKGWALKRLAEPRHSSVQSSFRPARIVFKPYNVDGIFQILRARAPLAFTQGAYSDDILKECAKIASYSGDARWALDVLLKAGDVAESRGGKKILEDDVKISDDMVEELQLRSQLNALTRPEKVYLKACCLVAEANIDPLTTRASAMFKKIAPGHGVRVYSDDRLKQLRAHLVSERFIKVYQGKGLGRGRGTEWRISFEEGYAPKRILTIFDSELI